MIELPSALQSQFSRISEHHLVKALDFLIAWALEIRASDIHFEPQVGGLNIRFRVDGVLHFVVSIPLRFAPIVLSRLKMLAHLDIAEKRLPQDGRFELEQEARKIGGRISTCPTIFGEKAVIRLLPLDGNFIPLASQGMSKQQLKEVSHLIESQHGLVIATGPTGSGKTMSLYALLDQLNDESRNLISIEDPVEMLMNGVNQVQIQEKTGLDFKTILRSLLRQDPDILMIGEIRDFETAEIAIKAAQTGHLVLSTIHTASSIQAISRLEQLGVPRYLIAEATKLIISQRLVRKICPPCDLCIDGFHGRIGIFEVLSFTPEIRHKVLMNQTLATEDYIDAMDLKAAGLCKVEAGVTTKAEVLRVV